MKNYKAVDKVKRGLTTVLTVLCVALIAFIVSKYFYRLAMVTGDSMMPTYKNLQFVLIDRRDTAFEQGDVIGFYVNGVSGLLIKRIVAVPGDKIEISNGKVIVNGEQSRILPQDLSVEYAGLAAHEVELGLGEFFVLGDNVKESKDSRYAEVGTVDAEQIVGKILPNRAWE